MNKNGYGYRTTADAAWCPSVYAECPADDRRCIWTGKHRLHCNRAGFAWSDAEAVASARRIGNRADEMTGAGHQDQPYRAVDRENQGWHLSGHTGETVYSADYGFERDLDDIATFSELAAARGPLRLVLPITDEDDAELRAMLTAAGRKAVTTLAAALEEVFRQVREACGGLNAPDSYKYAWRTLMAGREGSWESEALKGLVLFGNDLNLNRKVKGTANEARAAGPGKRVNKAARDRIAAVIHRWVTGPDRYTEVAETLAYVVSSYADRVHGADGWAEIADQWLQPGSLDSRNFRACYHLLYSHSEYFDRGSRDG